MTSVNARRALASQGGLARLVFKFENLGASKAQDVEADEARNHPTIASIPPDTHFTPGEGKDATAGALKTVALPSLSRTSAPLVTYNQLEKPAGNRSVPPSKAGKPSRRGLAVADMRRLFEKGLDKTTSSNVMQTATYEPKYTASSTMAAEYNGHEAPSLASSPMKGSSVIAEADTLAKPDLQEERDVVPDLVSIHCHVEHPEYLPRPLNSPDRSSRRSEESKFGTEEHKSTWQ